MGALEARRVRLAVPSAGSASGVTEPRVSWIDRIIRWGTTRRVPWWVLLLSGWAVAIASIVLILEWGPPGPPGGLRQQVGDTFYAPFCLWAYGWLVHSAHRAMDAFTPALGDDPAATDDARRRLTAMNPRTAAICGVVGLVVGVGALVGDPLALDTARASAGAAIWVWTLYLSSVPLSILVIAAIARMLRAVHTLHQSATRVDLFRPAPAHAFSRLTARVALVILSVQAYEVVEGGGSIDNPVWIVVGVVAVILAVLAFFVPLRSMHGRLVVERRTLLDACAARLEAIEGDLHGAVDARRYDQIEPIRGALEALSAERQRIEEASTWPWDRATLRTLATSFLIPLTIWVITAFAGHLTP